MNKKTLTNTQVIDSYKSMLLIRRFEEKSSQLYGMGLIGGFCHLYIGQEAVVVGCELLSEKQDSMITSYRDHGHMIVAGTDPKIIFAELLGKVNGCSKGKGGSMHMFDIKNGFYGGHGIVGAQVSIGTGLAFAGKYQNDKSVAFTYFGDGAVNQGQVYESFNMASLWNLPVIYVIENNEYAMGTSVNRSTAMVELYKKGESFNIPGIAVNGMDIFDIVSKCKDIVDNVRKNQTPYIIEMKTYRYRGHSMSDPANYRTKQEVSEYKNNHDCIALLKNYIIENKILSETDLKDMDKEIKKQINDDAEFAKNSPEPEIEELYTHIYADQ